MEFARRELQKYGWKEGESLGKHGTGIAEPIRPKLKFDNKGIGYSYAEDEGFRWWEHVYNKAARNLAIEKSNDNSKTVKRSSLEISTKRISEKKRKKQVFGSFLKVGTLTREGMVILNCKGGEEHGDDNLIKEMNDTELFNLCGGRTAHKAARHGIKLNGKMARLEKQERLLLEQMKNKR